MTKKRLNNPHLQRLPEDIEIVIGRMDYVLENCRNKRVLHLGCVDEGATRERLDAGTLLHTQLLSITKEVYGLDTSEEGLSLLREAGIPNLILGNVEQLDQISELRGVKFDIILAAEIIEHLNNPGLFLQSAKSLFHDDTVMIMTTPNAHRITGFGYRLKGLEFVHPDHNYWFSWSTLVSLLSKNGYQIIDARLYSFIDYKQPLIRTFVRKMVKKKPSGTAATRKVESQRDSSLVSRKIMRTIGSRVKGVARILSRRFLYSLNPFFADGLILIVKPVGSLQDGSK